MRPTGVPGGGKYRPLKFLESGEHYSDWLSFEGQDSAMMRIASKDRSLFFPDDLLGAPIPSFPTLVAQGCYRDSHYFVWNAPPGPTLRDFQGQQTFSLPEILDWAEHLLQGLALLSERGIVHGGLSPEALVLQPGGTVVRDLGIRTGRRPGCCLYCPPEARGEIQARLGPASDLYSLGLTLLSARIGPLSRARFGHPLEVLAWCGKGSWQAQEAELWNTFSPWFGRMIAYDPTWRFSGPKDALRDLGRLRDLFSTHGKTAQQAPDDGLEGSVHSGWAFRFSPLSVDSPWLPTELVGRDTEWAIWLDEVVRGEDGDRRALLLEGDYGVGKSRLLRDWGREAQARGWNVLTLSSEPPSLLTNEDQRENIANVFGLNFRDVPFLVTEPHNSNEEVDSNRPWLIILDDLNSAQQEARRFVSLWLARAKASGLVVAATRPEGREKVLVLPWTRMLSLGPLSLSETKRLAASLLGPMTEVEAQTCFTYSQGNPALVECFCCRPDVLESRCTEEGFRGWCSVHYQRCGEFLSARLSALHPAERTLLEAASVLGWMFSLRELAAITDFSGGSPDRLVERIVRWGLLQRRSTGLFDFTHPSLRITLYRGLSQECRREVHRRALEFAGTAGVRPDHAFFAGEFDACRVALNGFLRTTAATELGGDLTEILDRMSEYVQLVEDHNWELIQETLIEVAVLQLRLGKVAQSRRLLQKIWRPGFPHEPSRVLYSVVLAVAAIQPALSTRDEFLGAALAFHELNGNLGSEIREYLCCQMVHSPSAPSKIPVLSRFDQEPVTQDEQAMQIHTKVLRLIDLRDRGVLAQSSQRFRQDTFLSSLFRLHELAYLFEVEAFLQLEAELRQVPSGALETLMSRLVQFISTGFQLQKGLAVRARDRARALLTQAPSSEDPECQAWARTLLILSGAEGSPSVAPQKQESAPQGLWSLTELGLVSLSRGQLSQASGYLRRAYRRAQEDRLTFLGVTACCYLMTTLRLQFASVPLENLTARRILEDQIEAALGLACDLERRFPHASCHLNRERAWIAFLQGKPEEAQDRLKASLAQAEELGLPYEKSWTLYTFGSIGLSLGWPEAEQTFLQNQQGIAEQGFFCPEVTPGFGAPETITVSQMENSLNWGLRLLEESDLEGLEATLLAAAKDLIPAQTYTMVGPTAALLRGDTPRCLDQRLLSRVFDSERPLHFSALQGDKELMPESLTAVLAVRCGDERALWISSSRALQPFSSRSFLLLEGLSKFFAASYSRIARIRHLDVLRRNAQMDQQSFENLFKKSGVPLVLTDANRQIRVVNEAFRRRFHDRVPKDFEEILHLEDRRFSDVRQGESATRMVRYSDGSSARWGLLSQVSLSNSEILFSLTDRSLELFDQVFELFEQERHFVACELHDAVSAPLAALYFAWLSREPSNSDQEQLQEILARTRTLNLLPSFWVEPGTTKELVAQWRRRCESSGLEFTSNEAEISLSPLQRATIERVVGEALTNILRHARADRVTLSLWDRETEFGIEVSDDGCGFEIESAGQRFGLSTMRSRTQRAGARLEVTSSPGQGTRIRLVFPRVDGLPTA